MAESGEGRGLVECNFCAKDQTQVRKIVAGDSVFICDECIDLCNDILADELGDRPKTPTATRS